ncbi:periplasmic heavy metal sensor [Methylobacterium aquaticum]|uniref:periplasmic heavy metal sensor n=1 Tax=Methylobacterium aquaticum TaxID=270351 RepID=UPI003D17CD65
MAADPMIDSTPMTSRPAATPRSRILRLTVVSLALMVGAGTAGFALATGAPFQGWGSGTWDPGQRLAKLQFMTKRALDAVGATSEQENRVHDVIASAAAALAKEGAPIADTRQRLVELLKAPTVDRSAVEALRAEMVRSIDARSRIVAGALVDAAGQLSAEQRTKLIERVTAAIEQRRAAGPWGRAWQMDGQRRDRLPSEGGSGPDRD